MLSMLTAANMSDENKEKSSQELFYENTETIFAMLDEMKEGKKGFWWGLYVDFYAILVNTEHLEAYCYYITQSNGETEMKWVEEHADKVDDFFRWVQE